MLLRGWKRWVPMAGTAAGLAMILAVGLVVVLSQTATACLFQAITQETATGATTDQDSEKASDQESEDEKFVRVRKDESGRPLAMETSTTTYTRQMDDGSLLQVDLIGVVHIGEKEYFDNFNKQFKTYDALLYELVAPKGTRISDREEGGLNPVAALQKGMMSALDLEFQLEHIDYDAKNFVHADMSPTEFAESMEKNNESVSKMFFKMLGMSAAMQGQTGEAEMLSALFSTGKERIYRLRRTAAKQLIQMDVGMAMWEGDNGSTIITHRNGKAFEVLKEQIDGGKRRIGVFYGAGHLEDMEQRLIKDFKMKPGERKWELAWKLQEDAR